LKLVAKRGIEDSDKILRGDWQVGDSEYVWLSVWWAPSEEDYIYKSGKRDGYVGGEDEFPQLASSFVPEGSVVYAALSSTNGNRPRMIRDLQERKFHYAIPLWSWRKAKWEPVNEGRTGQLRGLFNPQRSYGPVYAEVDRDFVAFTFENYGSWMSDIWDFLVSRRPLANWAEHVHRVARKRLVTKELLEQIELVMSSRWEHGFELLSHSLSYDKLIEMAKEACTKLRWQLEVETT